MIGSIGSSAVSLRQARADCGLPEAGGFANVGEFKSRSIKDQLLSSDDSYTLKSLRGTVICNNFARTPSGSLTSNTDNTGARPNYNELSAWALNGKPSFRYTKSGNAIVASGENSRDNGYQTLGGYIFVGKIPPGSRNYKVTLRYMKGYYGGATVEVIGYVGGHFVGEPVYYAQWVNNSTNQNYSLFDQPLTMDGSATPYIALVQQGNNASMAKDSSYISVTAAYIQLG